MKPIEISEEQVLAFRGRRGHLLGPGADDPVQAARALLGAQAQVQAPALLSLSQRTAGRPTAASLEGRLFDSQDLVRTWGQRQTVHLYDPRDWPLVIAGFEEWAAGARGTRRPSPASVDRAEEVVRSADGPITRSDLFGIAESDFVQYMAERVGDVDKADRYAAGRLIFELAWRGVLCTVDKDGAEQRYAVRHRWLPDLPWDPPSPREANLELTRRYLAVNGPATRQDVAHHFGARIGTAREWLDALRQRGEISPVRCEGRKLWALAEDVEDLRAEPPEVWPVRLLPKFDTLLMGHADKSWTVPVKADRKRVWKRAAQVAATVWHRGRLVAAWDDKRLTRDLKITVEPLTGWTREFLPAVEAEAEEVARHYGLERVQVTVD